MGNNQLTFDLVPKQLDNVSVLGSLVLDLRDVLGPKALVNFSGIGAHKLLARDFIAALYEHASPGRIASDYSLRGYGTAIRELLKYCSAIAAPDDTRMIDIDFDFLLNYRGFLRVTRADFKSDDRRRLYGDVWRLLKAGQAIGLAHPDLEQPRNFRHVKDGNITQPYTAGEALDIEDACRNHIIKLCSRLEEGKALLAEGENPIRDRFVVDEKSGKRHMHPDFGQTWRELQNLIWYAVNVMDGKYLTADELNAQGHSTFRNATCGAWGVKWRKGDIYSHLYPLTEDLIPFIILLAKKTGRNESSILGLHRDCLQEINGRHILWYQKERGGKRLYKKPIPNDGPFSPVGLIRTLQRITEPLVRFAPPDDQGKLFLGLTVHAHMQEPTKAIDASYIKSQMNRDGGWCAQHELVDEHGQPIRISLRRWRVYYITRRYQSHGQLGKVSSDAAHTLSQTTVGYIHNDATKHIHERAIEDGINEARSLSRPDIIPDNSTSDAAATLGVSELQAERILRGAQDVFFASCKDFYNRPGGQADTPCDKPWGCLMCPNAIITRHVLPRVLAFRNFIIQQRVELPLEDWDAKFASVWHVLTNDIVPKFSSDAIAEAERQVCNETLYIPLAWKV